MVSVVIPIIPLRDAPHGVRAAPYKRLLFRPPAQHGESARECSRHFGLACVIEYSKDSKVRELRARQRSDGREFLIQGDLHGHGGVRGLVPARGDAGPQDVPGGPRAPWSLTRRRSERIGLDIRQWRRHKTPPLS